MTTKSADQPPPDASAAAPAPPVWWSVPQACVWIRTRNLVAVGDLDPRQALLLPLADHAKPGAVAASRCLRSALERGRFNARGRRIVESAPQDIPRACWQAGGDFNIDIDGTGAVGARDSERWFNVAVDRGECVRHWPAPHSVLANGPVPIQHLIEFGALHEGPEDNWAWFLGRDDVAVHGLNVHGHRVPIDRATLRTSPATIDSNGDLTLGELGWSCVIVGPPPRRPVSKAPPPVPTVRGAWLPPAKTVEAVAAAETKPSTAPTVPIVTTEPPRRRGPPPRRRNQVAEWKAKHYPNGVPEGVTVVTLQAELKADNILVSEDTIRRALGLKK
jgi:hypothetical protein